MGACSTVEITRRRAIHAILEAVGAADDEDLTRIMDAMFGGEHPMIRGWYTLSYFQIVPDDTKED